MVYCLGLRVEDFGFGALGFKAEARVQSSGGVGGEEHKPVDPQCQNSKP